MSRPPTPLPAVPTPPAEVAAWRSMAPPPATMLASSLMLGTVLPTARLTPAQRLPADANANGPQEVGELCTGGAEMRLETAGEVRAAGAELTRTPPSNANGHYRFDNVPVSDYT